MNSLLDKMCEETKIQSFYRNKVVFLTGATGFLGKLVLEKLLRSCDGIKKIYVLLREKKGQDIQERLKVMCQDVVFEKLKEKNKNFSEKIVAIPGDITIDGLGISLENREILKNNVNVFFHVAALVLFDEPLSKSVRANLFGVREAMALAKEMKNLIACVHVSTLYSNCHLPTIEECVNEAPINFKNMLFLTEILPEECLVQITPRLLNNYPNTYSFAKAIAEDMVQNEFGELPIAIFRPAIVMSTYKEPHKGWIDNLYGPTGVTAAAGNGLLRCLHADKNKNANLVPADMCSNALISIPWDLNSQKPKNHEISKTVPVYNFESFKDAPITWERYMVSTKKYGIHLYSINAIWIYYFFLIKNEYLFKILFFLMHDVPAILVDSLLYVTGKKTRMMKITKKIRKFTNVLSYFSTQEWQVESHRVQAMVKNMDINDQELFFCDLKKLDWDDYFVEYFKGIRVFLVKDNLDTVEVAMKRIRKFYIAHYILESAVIVGLTYLMVCFVKILVYLV